MSTSGTAEPESVCKPVTRIFLRSWGGWGAFPLEVNLAINVVIMIKHSDWDYRVNKIVKGVVTVSSHC